MNQETLATFAAATVVAGIMLAVGGPVAAAVGFFAALGVVLTVFVVVDTVDGALERHYTGK